MFSVWCGGRLPTEWEWEYTCRANCRDKDNRLSLCHWPDDNEGKQWKDPAWYDGNSRGQTHPVGMLKPNEFGLHDMLGNVWEWTESTYEQRVSRVFRGDVYNNGAYNDPGSASV
jgi:formylglycine-generating enzyme required for sulfatase activity